MPPELGPAEAVANRDHRRSADRHVPVRPDGRCDLWQHGRAASAPQTDYGLLAVWAVAGSIARSRRVHQSVNQAFDRTNESSAARSILRGETAGRHGSWLT